MYGVKVRMAREAELGPMFLRDAGFSEDQSNGSCKDTLPAALLPGRLTAAGLLCSPHWTGLFVFMCLVAGPLLVFGDSVISLYLLP
jgi:hypothetical protein